MHPLPTTHWTLVNRAGTGTDESRKEALAAIIRQYMAALREYLTARKRIAPERADDLLQGFIANEMIERDLLRNVHPSKGKFRNLLFVALNRYLINQIRHETRAKRGGGKTIPIEDAAEPSDAAAATPDDIFDLAWAKQVLDSALTLMEAECRENDRMHVWGVFDARILGPLVRGESPPAYEAMVERLKIESATQASNLLVTGKRMFVRALRAIVGEYALTDADIEAEIRDLQEILARCARR